jgi:hypothetical protein
MEILYKTGISALQNYKIFDALIQDVNPDDLK